MASLNSLMSGGYEPDYWEDIEALEVEETFSEEEDPKEVFDDEDRRKDYLENYAADELPI